MQHEKMEREKSLKDAVFQVLLFSVPYSGFGVKRPWINVFGHTGKAVFVSCFRRWERWIFK